MPPIHDIQNGLTGAWRMMLGKPDGLRWLDLSVDGFWNSFVAILIALPAMLTGWFSFAHDPTLFADLFRGPLDILLRLAVVDIMAWVLPIVALGAVARHVGLGSRFVPYVVANNWASAIFAWIMLPPTLVRIFWPDEAQAATGLSLILFMVSLFLSWRVAFFAIARGPGQASAVFAGMLSLSLLVLFALQNLLGLEPVS